MNKTSIEWTDFTWNPIRARFKDDAGNVLTGTACTHASPGCVNCYAEVINKRFGTGLPFSVPALQRIEFFIDEKILEAPLRRKKPAKIFVGDMFDLFHEAIPTEFLDRVFAVIGLAHWHTFQILTKRAERMRDYKTCTEANNVAGRIAEIIIAMRRECGDNRVVEPLPHLPPGRVWWPLENEHDGVSVESQKYADERIPLLLQTPAAVRFLSVEPMLEGIDLTEALRCCCGCSVTDPSGDCPHAYRGHEDSRERVDWVICGGESGPHSRHFREDWAVSLRDQCRSAGTDFFMKQYGSNACAMRDGELRQLHFKDRKGGDPSEWPESLRVREFPSPSQKAEYVK